MHAFTALPPAIRGALYMVFATMAWAALIIMVRIVSARYSSFEILFWRNLVSVLLMTPLMLRSGWAPLRTKRLPMHVLRAVLAYIGMVGMFYGIARIAIADVVALSFTQPLFISLMAGLLLGEVVGRHRWIAAAVGFLGVLVILRPGFASVELATMIVLGSALSYAGSNICIKALMRTDTPLQAVIFVNLLMLPLGAGPAAWLWVTPEWTDLPWFVGIGISGSLGVYFVSRAYNVADASAVTPYDFMRLPFAAGGAWLLFGETGDLWTWIGALIIFAGAYGLTLAEARRGVKGRN